MAQALGTRKPHGTIKMKFFSISTSRRIVQFFSLGALNSNFVGSAALSRYCLPVMNCEACVLGWMACPIGLLRNGLSFHEIPWIPILVLLGFGAVVGRFFCGWICPIGLLQDLLHKVPSRKFKLPKFFNWFKYVFLALTVFAVAWFLGGESPYFFCNFCPTAGIMVVLPAAINERDFMKLFDQLAKFILTLAMILGSIAISRPFCKIMCPIGAFVALTNKIMPWKLHLEAKTCIHCHKCESKCPMDLPVMKHQDASVNRDPECILCHECKSACPVHAIKDRGPLS